MPCNVPTPMYPARRLGLGQLGKQQRYKQRQRKVLPHAWKVLGEGGDFDQASIDCCQALPVPGHFCSERAGSRLPYVAAPQPQALVSHGLAKGRRRRAQPPSPAGSEQRDPGPY